MRLRSPREVRLATLHPNVGLEAEYRRRLEALVDAMARSVLFWVRAAYRANEPEIAADASPAAALSLAMRALGRRWRREFNDSAERLARYYAKAAEKRTDSALRQILKRGGFAVEFSPSRISNDVLQATIKANVALIKSIPERYIGAVEGSVMRSVQAGRDLASLTRDLRETHGIEKRRAARIARDQNNKATSAIARSRQLDLGIEEGIWMHSHGGKEPRPSHLANDGKRFSLKTGWFDPDERKWIMPGELVSCRCTWRPVVPGVKRSAA